MKKTPRSENPSDMLTHSPTKLAMDKFMPMLGLYQFEVSKGAVEIAKSSICRHPALELRIAAVVLTMTIEVCEAKRGKIKEERDVGFGLYFWMVHLWAAIGVIGLMVIVLMKIKTFICSRHTPVRQLEIWISEAGRHYHENQNCSGLAGARGVAGKKYCKKCVRC